MADVAVVERIALWDDSRMDEYGKKSYFRLPWDLVTTKPGVGGAPYTTFLEPINVSFEVSPVSAHTERVPYHRFLMVDASEMYGFIATYPTGGENRADK